MILTEKMEIGQLRLFKAHIYPPSNASVLMSWIPTNLGLKGGV